jgi:hypothetical protein
MTRISVTVGAPERAGVGVIVVIWFLSNVVISRRTTWIEYSLADWRMQSLLLYIGMQNRGESALKTYKTSQHYSRRE